MEATNATSIPVTSMDETPTYDEPYHFGRKPSCRCPFPFTEREFARLLVLRGRIQANPSALDRKQSQHRRS